MPKQRTGWECSVCGAYKDTEALAVKCEESHQATEIIVLKTKYRHQQAEYPAMLPGLDPHVPDHVTLLIRFVRGGRTKEIEQRYKACRT